MQWIPTVREENQKQIMTYVNRLGSLEKDVPQYFISVELNNVVVSLVEIQIQQILSIFDYLKTCQLREKYGRFRPWWSPLGKKIKGWQIAWWKYAQQSVLLDVQQRLRRTSWKYLGERLGILWHLLISREHKFTLNKSSFHISWPAGNPFKRYLSSITYDNFFMRCTRYLVQQELSGILWGLQGTWVLALKISCQLLYKVFSRLVQGLLKA